MHCSSWSSWTGWTLTGSAPPTGRARLCGIRPLQACQWLAPPLGPEHLEALDQAGKSGPGVYCSAPGQSPAQLSISWQVSRSVHGLRDPGERGCWRDMDQGSCTASWGPEHRMGWREGSCVWLRPPPKHGAAGRSARLKLQLSARGPGSRRMLCRTVAARACPGQLGRWMEVSGVSVCSMIRPGHCWLRGHIPTRLGRPVTVSSNRLC